ncbi:MAG TPA: hypothetical protein VH234_03865 [Candidatus Saccharimonadales bacterium]|jgi:hypothetical protein|nr:hypothetical protein [Candidatus Saccharimonadales bacterium]
MIEKPTLEERVAKLEGRNQRVEDNKAWETSWLRRGSIMLLTYLTVAFYLRFVIHISPWVNALVPVIGYTFSTLTISSLKTYWLKRRMARQQ